MSITNVIRNKMKKKNFVKKNFLAYEFHLKLIMVWIGSRSKSSISSHFERASVNSRGLSEIADGIFRR